MIINFFFFRPFNFGTSASGQTQCVRIYTHFVRMLIDRANGERRQYHDLSFIVNNKKIKTWIEILSAVDLGKKKNSNENRID